MARKTPQTADGKPVDAETGKPALPNLTARRARMQEGFEKLFKLEQRKVELEEQHLSDVKEQIKKERKNISADCDVEAADWKPFYTLYKRGELAKQMEDENDRDRIQDNMRFAFESLAKGDMVDFISALENETQDAA